VPGIAIDTEWGILVNWLHMQLGEVYQFPLYPAEIPAELKSGRLWICCDRDKVPLVATLRGKPEPASSTNPDTWHYFQDALYAYKARRFCGVGRVFEKDAGVVGVDIDHCRDPHTGRINTYGREILDALDSYSEVSPSGAGVKVWVYADIPASKVKDGLEIYRSGRYFTLTGQILPQYRSMVTERSEALLEIIEREFPKCTPRYQRNTNYDGPRLDLDEILESAGVEVLAEISDEKAQRKYRILCPWLREHTTNPDSGTVVGQYDSGALFFWCWHSHCRGRRWQNFRRVLELRSRLGSFTEVNISYG